MAVARQLLADFYIALAWAAYDRDQMTEFNRLMNLANEVWL